MHASKDSLARGVSKFWFLNIRNTVFSLVILVAVLQTTESLKTCQNKDGVRSIPCNHGNCSSDGSCLCQPCWKGAFCDIFVNNYEPTFDQLQQNIVTNVDVHKGKQIHQVQATDPDFERTCNGQLPCDCANITYSILSGNIGSRFIIDTNTGIISLVNRSIHSDDARYYLDIAAQNPNTEYGDVSRETTSVISLHILLSSKKENDHEYQHEYQQSRVKRFAPANPIPANNSFELEQLGATITDVEKGMVLSFRLYLHFALGTTDLLVEIFTPVNQIEVFSLCTPTITHVGSNIEFEKKEPTVDRSPTTGVNSRAVLDLGNVTNNGAISSNYMESIIKIEFKVTMVDPATDTSVKNNNFWISAGIEYNHKDDIWIAQKSFKAIPISNFSLPSAVFNLTGPSEVMVDTAVLFNLDLQLPILANEIKIDVFAPLNVSSVMTVCSIKMIGHGNNFGCLDTTRISSSLIESEISTGYSRGHLDLGYITNTMVRSASRNTTEDYFNIEFIMTTYNDMSLIGKTVSIGAAVMVGDDYIWTTRKSVEIVNAQPFVQAQPVQSSIKGGKLTVRPDEPAITYLHIVPSIGKSNIAVKLSLPAGSSSLFDVCTIAVISSGMNMPCVDVKQYFLHNADGVATLNLGTIQVYKAGNATDNEVILQLTVKPLSTTPKGTYTINAEVTSESTTVDVTPLTYDVNVFNDSVTFNDSVKPSCTINVLNDQPTILRGESTKIFVNITFPIAATFPNLEIESFAAETNGKYLFSLCNADISWVGRNIQCLNLTKIRETIQYKLKPDSEDFNYKVKVLFDSVCLTDLYTGEYDNTITIDVTYRLEDSIPNNTTWITAGLTINSKLWVGQTAIHEKPGLADVNPTGTQRVDLIDIQELTTSPLSYIHNYNISIKIPPLSAVNVVVNITSDSSDLSICLLRLVAKGSNIGCVRNTTTDVQATNSIFKKSIQIDFGGITNLGTSGIHQSTFFDKSTVLLEALVSLASASTETFTVAVTLGTQNPIQNTFTLTGVTNTSAINYTNIVNNLSSFVAAIAKNSDATLNKGEAKRVVTQFYVTPETFQSMKFQTRVDKIGMVEICDYNIIYSGSNIPCLDRKKITAENISKEEWMIEATVCSWPVNRDDPEGNKIQVEAIVKVPRDSAISLNDVFIVTTDIYVNNSLMETSQLQITVVDTFTEDFLDWMTNDNTTNLITLTGTPVTAAQIGEVFDLNINLSIPVNSTSRVKLDVSVPLTETAHMTIRDIQYNGSDTDIACIGNVETITASTNNTSQNDTGELDFGIVTNTGISRRILQQEEQYFSVIHVTLTIQMADAKENTDQSEKSILMVLNVGSFTSTFVHNVTVNRNAINAPKLSFEAGFNDTGRPLSNYFLTVNAIMRLENDSSAELRPALAIFYLSPWTQYADRFKTNKVGKPPAITFSNETGRLEFRFQEFFFTDDVKFSFGISRKPMVLSKSLVNSTTPYEAGGYITHHAGSNYVPNYFFSTPMNAFTFTVQIPPNTQSCGGKLNIDECQITAPLESSYQSEVFQTFIRSGLYAAERYLQIYFGNKVKVEKISMPHEHYSRGSVKVLKLAYSDDGMSWVSGPKITVATQYNISIPRPLESRYLRFYVMEHQGNDDNLIVIRLEFFGCQTSNEITNICVNAPKLQYPTGWYHRGFLEVESKVYICDANPKKDLRMFCYYTEDGISWYPLDTRLGNVNVYDKTKKVLYGISNDKVSYMSSNDGLFWKSVDPDKVIDLINNCAPSDCTKVLKIPWQNGTVLGTDTVSSKFSMTNWGASYKGIFKWTGSDWKFVADWSECGQ